MNKQTILSLSLIAATMLFTGCGSSPDAKFYILSAVDRNAPIPIATMKNQSVVVKVGPVSIPDMLGSIADCYAYRGEYPGCG